MTARELARAVRTDITEAREVDAWISGILNGRQGLHWKHFDAVADKLALSPSELVRYDETELRELTPREMKLLRHYQNWPAEMQDRWIAMLDFFAAAVPDKETAAILDKLRMVPPSWRRAVLATLYRALEGGIPPEVITAVDHEARAEGLAAPARPHLRPRKKPLSAKLKPRTDGR